MNERFVTDVAVAKNKYTAVYRCSDNIDNLRIRVRLRDNGSELEVGVFDWQQKRFGRNEKQLYGDAGNCLTELEREYHEEIKKTQSDDCVLFSYVERDCFEDEYDLVTSKKNSKLPSFVSRTDAADVGREFDYEVFLEAAVRRPVLGGRYQKMFLMGDFGGFVEKVWIKQEYVLCALRYDEEKKILEVFPDFSGEKPYEIFDSFDYYVENISETIPDDLLQTENDILNKIARHDSKMRARKLEGSFESPPRQKMRIFLFGEILSAENFASDRIYVNYAVDCPENFDCSVPDSLKGFTYSALVRKDVTEAYFGYPFEVCLECDLKEFDDKVPKPPYIYLEVVSRDSWNRFRSEGFTFKALPVFQPGRHDFQLACVRIRPGNLTGNLRRFFIGDFMSCGDFNWFGLPKDHQGPIVNKFGVETVETGSLKVRFNILQQSQALVQDSQEISREFLLLEKLNSSGLIRSVEQVLRAFREARKNMIRARRNVR